MLGELNRDSPEAIVFGGQYRGDLFELWGRRCDSSQWAQWLPRSEGATPPLRRGGLRFR